MNESYSILGMVKSLNVHGGVRRYFELGNAFIDRGHSYSLTSVQTKEKKPWIDFRGRAVFYEEWLYKKYDIVFTGANECFEDIAAHEADHKIIFVVAKFYADQYLKLWRRYGKQFKWIGVATDWNKGMEEIEGVCIPGGVNTNFFLPFSPEERERLTVSFYARTGFDRGVERILEVAKRVPNVNFVGFDAPNYETVRSGLPNVRIELNSSQEELRKTLQGSDVVMSAMAKAGWNNVAAEGSACGCVPIVTEAGTRDIVLHGKTGFLCSMDRFEDEAVEYLKVLAADYALKNRMARRAACWVRQFDWGIVVEKVLKEVGDDG